MRRLLPLALALSIVGCAGGGPGSGQAPASRGVLLDVWAGLDDGMAAADDGNACADTYGTYFADFGVRGLACAASQMEAPEAVVGRAPVAPFRTGPHLASGRAVRLDLDAEATFGHYDPAFVRWLATAALPEGDVARRLVQPVYDRHVARLARLYKLALTDLERDGFPEATPAGPLAAYARYLDGGPVPDGMEGFEGGFAVYAFSDRSRTLLPGVGLPIENDWTAVYEANTAYGFWLRRRADGTLALWRDALGGLLRTYDAPWLARR